MPLVQERSGHPPCLSPLSHLNGHLPGDSAIFGFDVHTPISWIESLLEAIGPVAAFPTAGNLDRNLVGVDEGLVAVRSEVPMVVDRRD
jgi:hypothetical protein